MFHPVNIPTPAEMLARLAEPGVVSCYVAESGPMVVLEQNDLNHIRACLNACLTPAPATTQGPVTPVAPARTNILQPPYSPALEAAVQLFVTSELAGPDGNVPAEKIRQSVEKQIARFSIDGITEDKIIADLTRETVTVPGPVTIPVKDGSVPPVTVWDAEPLAHVPAPSPTLRTDAPNPALPPETAPNPTLKAREPEWHENWIAPDQRKGFCD